MEAVERRLCIQLPLLLETTLNTSLSDVIQHVVQAWNKTRKPSVIGPPEPSNAREGTTDIHAGKPQPQGDSIVNRSGQTEPHTTTQTSEHTSVNRNPSSPMHTHTSLDIDQHTIVDTSIDISQSSGICDITSYQRCSMVYKHSTTTTIGKQQPSVSSDTIDSRVPPCDNRLGSDVNNTHGCHGDCSPGCHGNERTPGLSVVWSYDTGKCVDASPLVTVNHNTGRYKYCKA